MKTLGKNIYFTTNISIIIPTLGNEKEQQQIKFYEKLMGVDFLVGNQESQNDHFTRPTG